MMADSSDSLASQVKVILGEEEVEIPEALLEDKELFQSALNYESWTDLLTEEDKEKLQSLMPKHPSLSQEEIWRTAFSTEDLRLGGNPLGLLWEKLASGSLAPDVREADCQMKQLLLQQYKLNQANHFMHLLQELLLSRQKLLQRALLAGSLENMWKEDEAAAVGEKKRKVQGKGMHRNNVEQEYARVLEEVNKECRGLVDEDDPDVPANHEEEASMTLSEAEYRQILRQHRKRRRNHKVSYLNELEQLAVESRESLETLTSRKNQRLMEEGLPSLSDHLLSRRHPKTEQEVGGARKDVSSGRRMRKVIKERSQHEGTTAAQAKAIYKVYTPIDNGSVKDTPYEPLIIEGPLPQGKYKSYFSLIKAVFEPLNDRKGELGKLSKNLGQLINSAECADSIWLNQRSDWVDLTLSALCYLAAEVGAVSSFSPLPHFVPLIEFRDRIDHWKWIGNGRDSEMELLVLTNHWMENLDKTLPVVDYSDYEPPPPHVWTKKTFQGSSSSEVARFQEMEQERYASPHKAYVYNIRGYESPVGPVKGAKVTKKDSSSKARGHALLVPNRPNCVTILSLVRDATSRLPNGEGTRLDLCIQVQDSQYIAESVSETQLNNAVSGALDRLHYEKDPCVRYDGARKVWIYLHRARSEEDFERIHWACEVAAKQRKALMARPKIKPRIILRMDGKDEILEPGTAPILSDDSNNKVGKKLSTRSLPSTTTAITTAGQPPPPPSSLAGEVAPSTPLLPQPGQLSRVVASVVHGGLGISPEVGGVTLMTTLHEEAPHAPASKVGGASIVQMSTIPAAAIDQKPHRKRKQSLKVAELLLEGVRALDSKKQPPSPPNSGVALSFEDNPGPGPGPTSVGSISSSSWSSDSEEDPHPPHPAPLLPGLSDSRPHPPPPPVPAAPQAKPSAGGDKSSPEAEGSSPEF